MGLNGCVVDVTPRLGCTFHPPDVLRPGIIRIRGSIEKYSPPPTPPEYSYQVVCTWYMIRHEAAPVSGNDHTRKQIKIFEVMPSICKRVHLTSGP